jgi:hypothetical protein
MLFTTESDDLPFCLAGANADDEPKDNANTLATTDAWNFMFISLVITKDF